MKSVWFVALALALAPLMATAAGPREVRRQVESSMLVTGEIEIDAQGQVSNLKMPTESLSPFAKAQAIRGGTRMVPGWG